MILNENNDPFFFYIQGRFSLSTSISPMSFPSTTSGMRTTG